ncbi:Transcriptional regulator, LuxR family [Lysobacter dokdonensis DS-58]|uniref:Transcriptional regulator, LuxR family n=1 Tax=Lysobacter dokdonensis DS-58 TaxID=1300345 RepID=A0A0A2WJK4_9GAMM|nr:response regulator transcription factor [Lysobacter dokdonensis]KGQ18902.1 Transcriptional regulator, LuxR family [Lysobacter dokdonensis DS-58]
MRILLADDHPIICVALGEMLGAAFPSTLQGIDTVADSDALLAHLESEAACDLLVLDLFMPGAAGSIPLLERVLAMRPGLRVVTYTGANQPMLAQQALAAGARAFVSKASGPDVALQAVHAVLGGQVFVDPRVDLDAARKHPWHTLTPGERGVIVALASGHHLHGIALDSDRSYKTVTAHKYNALRKLNLDSKTDLKHYLSQIGLGYLLGST